MNKMLIVTLIAMATLIWWFSDAVDTTERLQAMELKRLEFREEHMYDLYAFLENNPNPRSAFSGHLFLSSKVIKKILKGLDKTTIPLKGGRGLVHIDGIRHNFANGVPEIFINARAVTSNGKSSIDLAVHAWLELVMPEGSEKQARLRVHVEEIVPIARWHNYQIRIAGLMNALMNLPLEGLIPDVPVPLTTDIPLDQPATTKELPMNVNNNLINNRLSFPGFSTIRRLSLSRVIYLDNGIHLFVDFKFIQGDDS